MTHKEYAWIFWIHFNKYYGPELNSKGVNHKCMTMKKELKYRMLV